jgi:hypothetical protein
MRNRRSGEDGQERSETLSSGAKRIRSQRCADSEHLLLALAANGGIAGDILAEHDVGEDEVREALARLLEREAPELAAKLRAPKRRRVRRRSRA